MAPARALGALLCAALTVAAPARAEEYILDDGSGGFTIGPSDFDAQMTWGNYFDTDPACPWITGLRISFSGSLPPGTPLTLMIFDDPDDDLDPANAVPLALTSAVSGATGSQDFIDYRMRPVRVEGGFFVAASAFVAQRQSTARMDQDTLGVRSWLFFSPELTLDLGAAPFSLRMSESPFVGTWMVRAIGAAAACEADLDADGTLTVFDFLAFQNAFAAGDLLADFDLDLELTIFDFLAFQNAFAGGC
ncbi:MAG: GC-type dockerin domain-anchored protein [Phycisphaerales bacterium JB039]